MSVRTAVLMASLLGWVGCVGCSAPNPEPPAPSAVAVPTGASAELAARPLSLPSLGPGGSCPITPAQPWSGPGVARAVLGSGPVYPVADYFADATVLQLRDDDRQPDGTYSKKVRWIGVGYAGPVLIRTRRIDGEGTALVRFSDWGQARDGGYYADLPTPNSDLPAVTNVSGPGCYVYQVDGNGFTARIVFRAVSV